MFARSPLFQHHNVSHHSWIAAKLSVRHCENVLQASCPPMQSWISVCVRREQRRIQGKHPCDHVNTTHRSHREWRLRNSAFLWPAYISCCLALAVTTAELFHSHKYGLALPRLPMSHAFFPFFSQLFFFGHIMEDTRQFLLSREEEAFSFPCWHCCMPHREGQSWIVLALSNTFLPTCSLFSPFSFSPSTAVLESKYKSTETEQCYQESTSLLLKSHWTSLFSCAPPLTNTFLTSTLLLLFLLVYSSVAEWATAGIVKSVWSSVRLH